MVKLVFATNNAHKLSEVRAIAGARFSIISLQELGCFNEIPETGDTLTDNALQKAKYIHDRFHCNCFADDTGLEIEALAGRPGVYSARYAGEHCSSQDNIQKVLHELQDVANRKACFKTVIALILDGKNYFFEGAIEGEIIEDIKGSQGFGYDPIFKPLGYDKTFAEMTEAEKNSISHRALATKKLNDFLQTCHISK
ncbi:MAG: non-canonical purine NTP diphosphatase [Bacteroidetes bacterium]|nr:non-canonical purine NTP diphosphatase [Bacteroidota bacterium]MCL2303304.1 non-canonical purine NTP diphosphatase [Lentimicrobiaceae bacterium]